MRYHIILGSKLLILLCFQRVLEVLTRGHVCIQAGNNLGLNTLTHEQVLYKVSLIVSHVRCAKTSLVCITVFCANFWQALKRWIDT